MSTHDRIKKFQLRRVTGVHRTTTLFEDATHVRCHSIVARIQCVSRISVTTLR